MQKPLTTFAPPHPVETNQQLLRLPRPFAPDANRSASPFGHDFHEISIHPPQAKTYSPHCQGFALPETSLQREDDGGDSSDPRNISFSIAADRANGHIVMMNDVGHAWIKIQMPDDSQDSYGFWPVEHSIRTATYGCGGEVHHPDTAHNATDTETVMVTGNELQDGIEYANQHAHDTYRLFGYNCTAFAREMWTAATGLSAPFAGYIIADPKDLADSIAADNARANDPGSKQEGSVSNARDAGNDVGANDEE